MDAVFLFFFHVFRIFRIFSCFRISLLYLFSCALSYLGYFSSLIFMKSVFMIKCSGWVHINNSCVVHIHSLRGCTCGTVTVG